MNLKSYLKDHITTVMAVSGCIGFGITAVLAGKGAVKAYKIKQYSGDKKLTWKQRVICYGPAVGAGVVSTAMVLGGDWKANQIIGGLTTLAVSNADILKEYEQSAKNVYGEEANHKIREDIAKRKEEAAKTPETYDKALDNKKDIIKNGFESDKQVWFYDTVYENYIHTTMANMLRAEKDMNGLLYSQDVVAWATMYDLVGQPLIRPDKYPDVGYSLADETTNWNASFSSKGVPWIEFIYTLKPDPKHPGYVYCITPEFGPYETYLDSYTD